MTARVRSVMSNVEVAHVVTEGRLVLLHRLQFGDEPLDHLQPDAPERRIARIKPEGREKFVIGLRSTRLQQMEIALGEALMRLLIDAIK